MKESITQRISIWLYLHNDDIKGVFKIVLPLLFVFFVLRNIPFLVREFTIKNLDVETIGVIESIEKRKGIYESETGGRVVVKDFKIKYQFRIDNIPYESVEIVTKSSISMSQFFVLDKLNKGDSVLIGYSSENLNHSKLIINE